MNEIIAFFVCLCVFVVVTYYFVSRPKETVRVVPSVSISRALATMHDRHKMLTGKPLVVTFSHYMARHEFMRQVEADIGMHAGELVQDRPREVEMYDGIEFRVSP